MPVRVRGRWRGLNQRFAHRPKHHRHSVQEHVVVLGVRERMVVILSESAAEITVRTRSSRHHERMHEHETGEMAGTSVQPG